MMRAKLGLAAVSLMIATTACGAEEASTLKLTENGLGGLGSGTAYSVEGVSEALPGYAVTAENYYAEGDPYPMIVVRDGDQVIAEVLPRFEMEELVGSIIVKSGDISFDERISLGVTYADLSVAPKDCVAGMEERSGLALCRDGEVPHRSEEHTSELQSLAYLVCRLLLEKKKHSCGQQLKTIIIP